MRTDLGRLESRHAAFVALGDKRVEMPIEQRVPQFTQVIAFEPLRSVETGKQLAAGVAEKIEHLRNEIERTEQEIDRLLASR